MNSLKDIQLMMALNEMYIPEVTPMTTSKCIFSTYGNKCTKKLGTCNGRKDNCKKRKNRKP